MRRLKKKKKIACESPTGEDSGEREKSFAMQLVW